MVTLTISRQADKGQKATRVQGSLDWGAWFCPEPLAGSLVSSIMRGSVHQLTQGTVTLNDGKFIGSDSVACSLPISPLHMSGNLHPKPMTCLHPLLPPATALQFHLCCPVYPDAGCFAKHEVSLRVRQMGSRGLGCADSQPRHY